MSFGSQVAPLSPTTRLQTLERFASETFDVLVIGGGVTGCGVALDAASRGLSVALVEKTDFAAGTSSRSSKLIHGGLRYLEHLDFDLVREALAERRLLLQKIAPHLVRATPFLFPLRRRGWDRLYMGAGIALYDALAGIHAAVPRHRHLSRTTCSRDAPALRPDVFCGGIRYYDGQMDDARFGVVLARTAMSYGALCASGVEVTSFLRAGERIRGAHIRDHESTTEFDLRARVVVNATGVWTTAIERLAGVENPLLVRPSKGVHLVVPRQRLDLSYALILPTEKSVLFVLPWEQWWIIGTTDTDWSFSPDQPAATRADIDYLLDHVNQVLVSPLTSADIVGVYAGLRPLVSASGKDTAKLSRSHQVRCSAPGLVSVAGGKYTTYRIMARDAVDAAARELDFAVDSSRTADIPLVGAVGFASVASRLTAHPAGAVLAPEQIEHLIKRYGSLANEVLDLVAREPDLGKPLSGAESYLAAEIHYAASHEGARHVDDALSRRTHIAFEMPDRGREAARAVANLMGKVLSWSDEKIEHEVTHYWASLEAALAAESMPDDASAHSLLAREQTAETEFTQPTRHGDECLVP